MSAVSHLNRPQAAGARHINGSGVSLRKTERGFIYGGGAPSARDMPAGTAGIIFASEAVTIPRWQDVLVQVLGQLEFRYRVQITLNETYNVIEPRGDPIFSGRKGGLIPHSALSRSRNGPALSATDWTPGTPAYLLKNHTYTGSQGTTEIISRGECVLITSLPLSLTSSKLTSNPSLAHYKFQRTTESNRRKIWLSAEKIHESYLV